MQSANTEELRMLERIHNFFTVIEAVSTARKAGFDNLNLDLIYGLPEQTLQTWQITLQRIIELQPEHISAYALNRTRHALWKLLLVIQRPAAHARSRPCRRYV